MRHFPAGRKWGGVRYVDIGAFWVYFFSALLLFYALQLSGLGNGIGFRFHYHKRMGEPRLYQWTALPHLWYRRIAHSGIALTSAGKSAASVLRRFSGGNGGGICHCGIAGKTLSRFVVGLQQEKV